MSIVEKLTFAGPSFQADDVIGDLSGKVILVTGGNNGLGKETILQLAKHNPAKIYMGSRNSEKAKIAIGEIAKLVPDSTVEFLKIDLSSFASVKNAVAQFLEHNQRLDILINNAGIMGVASGLTEDGYEVHFGTNHMGPALLTKLLIPIMEATSQSTGTKARVVNIASVLYSQAPKSGIPFSQLKTDCQGRKSMELYGITKLANIYHAHQLAKRHENIISVSLHPGLVRTDIIGGHFKQESPLLNWLISIPGRMISVDVAAGALNQIWASTSEKVKSGAFYMPYGKLDEGTSLMSDNAESTKLWTWTEEEFRMKGL